MGFPFFRCKWSGDNHLISKCLQRNDTRQYNTIHIYIITSELETNKYNKVLLEIKKPL